ncbi:unnamed protein product [Prorocentrum cordatum]|uniref:RRM domain-containing protein n=1 Tax=Prorocentrum cordatum TaxID=2364126 RepID=A0ABN9X0B7_9DINO|nr:unnamed protein product [Polarella glacialis]
MGAFAFVEFQDEMLASTAMLFSGFELCGRSAGMGRPQGYLPPPNGEAPALDVTPLRQRGLLPVAPSNSMCGKNQREGKLRELYFGNLVRGKTSPDVILKLIDPVAKRLAEWREQEGHAVTNVNVGPEGTYAFVQFQSIQLATKIMQIFDGQEVFGRVLRVRRTNTFEEAAKGELKAVEALQALLPEKVASTSRTAPFLMPPPPPGPPPEPAELPPEQLPLDAPPAPPEVQEIFITVVNASAGRFQQISCRFS